MRRLLVSLACLLLLWGGTVSAQSDVLLVHPQNLDRQHPLLRGLLGWWVVAPHLSGGNQWWDWVGRNHATLTNGPFWAVPTCPGFAKEILFDGTNEYADAGVQPQMADVRTVSVVARIRVGSVTSGSGFGRIFDKRANGGWALFLNNTDVVNGIGFAQNFDVDDGLWALANVITVGTCVTVGVTYDSRSLSNVPTFYVNGKAFAPSDIILAPSGTYVSDASSPIRMGDRGDATRAFGGGMSDVRFYNRLLADWEMLAIHRSYTQTPLFTEHFLSPVPAPAPTFASGAVTPRTRLRITIE